MSATTFETVAHSACAMSFRTVQNASSRLTLVLCPSITIDRLTIEDFILIGPSLYPVMGVTDSVPREQPNTCKKLHEDFWHGSSPLSFACSNQGQQKRSQDVRLSIATHRVSTHAMMLKAAREAKGMTGR